MTSLSKFKIRDNWSWKNQNRKKSKRTNFTFAELHKIKFLISSSRLQENHKQAGEEICSKISVKILLILSDLHLTFVLVILSVLHKKLHWLNIFLPAECFLYAVFWYNFSSKRCRTNVSLHASSTVCTYSDAENCLM